VVVRAISEEKLLNQFDIKKVIEEGCRPSLVDDSNQIIRKKKMENDLIFPLLLLLKKKFVF
jgi:hypothetical protein